LACFWPVPGGSWLPFGPLSLPGLPFLPPPPGGPAGAPGRGPQKGPLLSPFWACFGALLGVLALPPGFRGRGPWVLRASPGGPPRGPQFGPVFSALLALFSGPVRAPHFPPPFSAGPFGAPKGAHFGPFFGPFWPFSRPFGPRARFWALQQGPLGPSFWAPSRVGSLFGPFRPGFGGLWPPKPGPARAPHFPPLFPSGRPPAGQRAPKGAPKGPQKGPFWGPFWGPLAGPGRSSRFWRAKSVVGLGGRPGPPSRGPPGGSPGPLRGRFWLFLGLFSARFGCLFWPSVSAGFLPVGPGFALPFGLFLALFLVSFWCFSRAFGPAKALGFRAVSRLLVGFRVKSPFSALQVPKWVKVGHMALFRVPGQAGVYAALGVLFCMAGFVGLTST